VAGSIDAVTPGPDGETVGFSRTVVGDPTTEVEIVAVAL
jgi:hypothetical protein